MSMSEETSSWKDELDKQKELDRKRFGTENTLMQILWDGQVEEECFNETMTAIVLLARQCVEDEEWKKQLYEIDLEDYKDEEE